MITSGAAALGAAGVTALGGILGAGMNSISANMANKWNRREAEKNRKWQEEMWNKQNKYNLPVNQLQRIKDAGLNPNLVFGQNGMSTQGASFNATPVQPNMVSPQYGDMLKGVGSAIEVYQRIQKNNAEIRLLDSQKRLNDSNASGQDWLNNFNLSTEEIQKHQKEVDLHASELKNNLTSEEITRVKNTSSLISEQINTELKKQADLQSQIDNRGKLTDAQVNDLASKVRLRGVQMFDIIMQLPHKIAMMDATTRKLAAEKFALILNAKTNASVGAATVRNLDAKTTTEETLRPYKVTQSMVDIVNGLKDGTAKDLENAFKRWRNESLPPAWFEKGTNMIQKGAGTFKSVGDALNSWLNAERLLEDFLLKPLSMVFDFIGNIF